MMVHYVNVADNPEKYTYGLWRGLRDEADTPFSTWAGLSLHDRVQNHEDYSDSEMFDMVNPTRANVLVPTTFGNQNVFVPTQDEAEELDLGCTQSTVFMTDAQDAPMCAEQ